MSTTACDPHDETRKVADVRYNNDGAEVTYRYTCRACGRTRDTKEYHQAPPRPSHDVIKRKYGLPS